MRAAKRPKIVRAGGGTMQPVCATQTSQESFFDDSFPQALIRLIGPDTFERWFRHKTRLRAQGDELVVGVAGPFLLTWLQKQFRGAVQQAANAALGPSARIRFEVDPLLSVASKPNGTEGDAVALTMDVGGPSAARGEPAPPTVPAADNPPVAQDVPRPGRRFADLADFVPGPGNELALTAARQICARPEGDSGPLYLYGPVGTGKTHLLEGMYRHIRRAFPRWNVMYLTSEQFTNYFTQAYRDHKLPEFRQRFRNVDVLLVDDVDFLDAKRGIQEELLHTVKQLEGHRRLVVVAADRHPRLMTKISDELRTRFLSGMVCRLEPPDCETRERIAARKAEGLDAEFSPEAIRYVAERFRGSVRELEGALHCLQVYHKMTGRRIGVTAARQVLADLERDCIKVVRMTDVERVVCDLFGLQTEELRSSRRNRSVSQPRMLAMYLARRHTQAAYSEIGAYFGGRNHATVISAEKKINEWLAVGSTFRVASQTWRIADLVQSLEQQLLAG